MPWFNLPGYNTGTTGAPSGSNSSTSTPFVPYPFPIQSALAPNYILARSQGYNPVSAHVVGIGSAAANVIKDAKEGVDSFKSNLWLILLAVSAILFLLLKRK